MINIFKSLTKQNVVDAYNEILQNVADTYSEISQNAVVINNKMSHNLLTFFGNQSNLFISSFSLLSALQILYIGVQGTAADELNKYANNYIFGQFVALLKKVKGFQISNLVIVRNDIIIKESYRNKIQSLGSVWQCDINDKNKVISQINAHVEKQTNGIIRNSVNESDITGASHILLNTLYFKGEWASPFNQGSTKKSKFTCVGGETKIIDMMYKPETMFPYYETDDFQLIELPYKSSRVHFGVMLPRQISKCNHVFDNTNYMNYVNKLKHCYVDLHLPKFSHEYTIDMTSFLMSYGINKIFNGPDMGNMQEQNKEPDTIQGQESGETSKQSHSFQQIIQKTRIILDEKGTEAATITTYASKGCFMKHKERKVYDFCADRTFIYYIRDHETNLILFSGIF